MNQRLVTILGSAALVLVVGLAVAWFATPPAPTGDPTDQDTTGKDAGPKDANNQKAGPWLDRLASDDPAVRRSAYGQLDANKADAAKAVPVLLARLAEKDPATRSALSGALAALARDDGDLRDKLTAALDKEPAAGKAVAALALGKVGVENKAAIEPLHKALFGDDADLQRVAALTLRRVAPRQPGDYVLPSGADSRAFPARWLRITHLRTTSSDDTNVIPPLVAALDDPDPDLRQWSAEVFAEEGDAIDNSPDAVPALLKLFTGTDDAVARTAARALGKLSARAPSIAPKILAALADAQPAVRRRAAEALTRAARPLDDRGTRLLVPKEFQTAEAIAALAKAVEDANNEVRTEAIRTLGGIGPAAAKALPALAKVAASADADKAVRVAAFAAIGQIGQDGATAVPALLAALKDPDDAVQRAAAEALARYGKEAVPALRKALGEADVAVQFGAVQALAAIGPDAKDALAELTPLLKGDQAYPRLLAATAVLRIDPTRKDALPVLKAGLADGSLPVRLAALDATTQLGPVAADLTADLAKALADEDLNVARRAAEALGAIGPAAAAAVPALAATIMKHPDTKPYQREIFIDKPEYLTQRCRDALRRIGLDAKPAVSALVAIVTACDDPDAADLLSLLDPSRPEGIKALKAALASPYDNFRETALRAIGRLGATAKDVVPELVERLPQETNLTSPVKEALIRLGPVAVPKLVEALANPAARLAALHVLGRIGPAAKDAVPAMLKAADGEFAIEGLVALAGLGESAGPALVEAAKEPARAVAALRALATLKGRAASVVKPLADLLKDAAFGEKAELLRTLAALGPAAKSAAPAVAERLADGSQEIQAAAGLALVAIGGDATAAVPVLLKVLEEAKSQPARRDAALALGRLPDQAGKSLPLLRKLAADAVPELRAAAVEAMTQLEGSLPDLVAAVGDADPAVREAACRAVGDRRTQSAGAVTALVERLKATEPEKVQLAAIVALGQIGPAAKAATPALRGLLDAGDAAPLAGADPFAAAERQTRLARSLWRIEGKAAAGEVVGVARRQLDAVTYPPAVAEVLALVGDLGDEGRDLTPRVGPMVDSAYQHIRRAAVQAVAKIGPSARGALPWLQRAADQEADPELRQQAKDALAAVRKG